MSKLTSTKAVVAAIIGGGLLLFASVTYFASKKESLYDQPNLRLPNQGRMLLGFNDPKSVDIRSPGPPVFDAPLIRSVFNGRGDAKKDALVDMWTMTSKGHRRFAKEAVRRINQNKVVGDIVECGVWMGGMTMLLVFENMKEDITRHFWLFDTFDGLPEPDGKKDGARAKRMYNELKEGKMTNSVKQRLQSQTLLEGKWNYGPLDIVRNNLRYTGYPEENFHYIKGKVEDTLPVTQLPDKIAILRLDTDWYLSTKAEMEYMYDRLQSGGVLIIDDYCAWQGARTAIDEFFSEKLQLDASQISKESPCLVYWKP